MENSIFLTPRIVTPFNYLNWRADMHMGREVEPQKHIEKSKYLNKIDEAFGFMCIHISRELLFHLNGLKTL